MVMDEGRQQESASEESQKVIEGIRPVERRVLYNSALPASGGLLEAGTPRVDPGIPRFVSITAYQCQVWEAVQNVNRIYPLEASGR
jgi:hypothetical protein